MASWTDTPELNFNPYISSVPADIYTQMGIYKQQMYNEGLNKTQQFIDTVAGIEVIKPEHKQYLQESMNSLKNELSGLASSDFSSQRVVNQATGYAAKLMKDPILTGAAMSTANYKKGLSQLEQAKKEGKGYGVENEWYFQKNYENWVSDGDIKSTFNSSYTPHVNVMEEFLKLYKEVHPDTTLSQEDIKLDSSGRISVLSERSFEGVTPQKVQSVFNLLSQRPDIQNQMYISGSYQYRGGLNLNAIKENYNTTATEINNKISELQNRLSIDKTADATSISKEIETLKQTGTSLLDNYTKTINSSPEEQAYLGYKTYLNSNLINAFSWGKTTAEIKESPIYNAQMKQLNYELDLAKFNQSLTSSGEGGTKGIGLTTTVTSAPIETTAVEYGSETFKTKRDSTVNEFNMAVRDRVNAIARMSGDIPPTIIKNGKAYPNVGSEGYSTVEAANEAFSRIYGESRKLYSEGKGTPQVNDLFMTVDPLLKSISAMDYQMQKGDEAFNRKMSQLKTSLPTVSQKINYVDRENNKVVSDTLTTADLVDYYAITKGFDKNKSSERRLNTKFGGNGLSVISEALTSQATGTTSPFKNLWNNVYNTLEKDKSLVETVQNRENYYKDIQLTNRPKEADYVTSKTEQKEYLKNYYTGKISSYYGNFKDDEKQDASDVLEWLGEKEGKERLNFGYKIDKNTDKTYLKVTKGSDTRYVEIPRNELADLSGFNVNDPFWEKYGASLSMTNNSTTETYKEGKGTGEMSAFAIAPLPGAKYQTKYHLVNAGGDFYYIKLYVRDNMGNILLDGVAATAPNMTGPMSQNQIMTAIAGLNNDNLIEKLVEQNQRNAR